VGYGHWYQRQALPDLDQRKIARVESTTNGFKLILEAGETVIARRLVVAAGIGLFTYRPPEFAGLPRSLASHTSEHLEFQGLQENKCSLSEAVRVHLNRPHSCTKAAPKSKS